MVPGPRSARIGALIALTTIAGELTEGSAVEALLWSGEQDCPVGDPPCAGTWFGVHVPMPQTVVSTASFVAVLSGLYFTVSTRTVSTSTVSTSTVSTSTVSTSVDPLYRQRSSDPLITDVGVNLAGRDAYLQRERHDE